MRCKRPAQPFRHCCMRYRRCKALFLDTLLTFFTRFCTNVMHVARRLHLVYEVALYPDTFLLPAKKLDAHVVVSVISRTQLYFGYIDTIIVYRVEPIVHRLPASTHGHYFCRRQVYIIYICTRRAHMGHPLHKQLRWKKSCSEAGRQADAGFFSQQ